MKRTEILRDEHRTYCLSADASGALFLEVLTGGIGLEVMTLKLTEDESSRFRSLGKSYLDELAYDVGKHPENFAGREQPDPS